MPAAGRQGDLRWIADEVAGEEALLDHRGVLYLPADGVLVVSDLHLEKGAAHARRGYFLPPYDTAATLARLASVIGDHAPDVVICLGDSFHDRRGAAEMAPLFAGEIAALARGRDWIWVAGNHDPDAPAGLPGDAAREIALGRLVLRHEPAAGPGGEGEIAGHLHPGARVVARGRSVRRACFAGDGRRLVMPAFGAFTGSLNVLDRACRHLFEWSGFRAHMLGGDRLYRLARSALRP